MKHELTKEVANAINVLSDFCKDKACAFCPLCSPEKECVFGLYTPYAIRTIEVKEPKFVVEVND